MLLVSVALPLVLGAIESDVRAAAGTEDRVTFFAPSMAAAAVSIFLPLALAANPTAVNAFKRFLLFGVRALAVGAGFAGLAVWHGLLSWSLAPEKLSFWAQWMLTHGQRLSDWLGYHNGNAAIETALIYYAISVFCAFLRWSALP